MLTRRAFAVFASLLPFVLSRRAAAEASDLPPCEFASRVGPFSISGGYYQNGTLGFFATFDPSGADDEDQVKIPSTNSERYASVSPFAYNETLNVDGSINANRIEFDFAGEQEIMGPADAAFYELVATQRGRIASVQLEAMPRAYWISDVDRILPVLMREDFQIRISLGPSVSQWTIVARDFNNAVREARQRTKAIGDAYFERSACEPADPGGCLLTTVACRQVGLDDDCFELRTIRRLRDKWLARQAFGPAALSWYYEVSPRILSAVPRNKQEMLFRRFYVGRVVPAVIAERLCLHRLAFVCLRRGVMNLQTRFLPV